MPAFAPPDHWEYFFFIATLLLLCGIHWHDITVASDTKNVSFPVLLCTLIVPLIPLFTGGWFVYQVYCIENCPCMQTKKKRKDNHENMSTQYYNIRIFSK